MNAVQKKDKLPGIDQKSPGAIPRRTRAGYLLLSVVLLTSILNLAGWIFNIPVLRAEVDGWTTMKPSASVSFVFAAVSLFLLQYKPGKRISVVPGLISGFVLISIGSVTLSEYIFELNNGGSATITTGPLIDFLLDDKYRMAFITSLLFILAGFILVILSIGHKTLYGLVHSGTLLIILVNYFVPMSYVTGVTSIYLIYNIPVALHTGINFILLGTAILVFYPDTWLMRVFLDKFTGGSMARRMIPWILIIPIIISWLRLKGEQMAIFSSETGIILAGVTYTFCFMLLVWFTARRVIRIDKSHRSLNAELAEQAYFIKTITGTIPDIISIVSLPSRKLLYMNKGSFSGEGLKIDMPPDTTFDEFLKVVHPDDRQSMNRFMDNLSKKDNDELASIEFRLRTMDGKWLWFRARSKVFERSGGRVKSCINVVQNITAEKEAEIRLVTSELRFRTLADNISQLVWIIDNHGKYLWFNKQWFEYTGITLDEMQHGGIRKVIHPDYIEKSLKDFQRAVAKKESWKAIFPMRNKNGDYRWFINQALPISDPDGKVIHWFGTNTDIHEQKLAEDRAVLLNTQLEALLKSIPVGVLVYDRDLNIIRTNSAANELLRYRPDEFKRNYFERNKLMELRTTGGTKLKPEEMPAYRAAVNNETIINEILLFNNGEKTLWISFSAAPYIVEGNRTGAVISMMDITVVKKAEQELYRSREELSTITENSPDIIARFDTTMRHTFINSFGEKIYGRPRDKIIGKNLSELDMPENMIDSWRKNFEDVILTGEEKNVEFDFHSTISGRRFFYAVLVPEKDCDGKILSILAIARDITKLREAEEKFRTLFENISEGVAIHEIVYEHGKPVNYRIIDVNPAYQTISGIDTKKAIGSLATDLYATPEPPFFKEYLEVALTGKPYRFETYFQQIDRYFMIDAVSPRPGQFATVFEDISDQKRTEIEIKKKNEELTRFIYTVSHDLKSPLVTIKSFIAYLKEDIEKKDKIAQDRDIMYIDNAAGKMGNLLHELLELSRIGRKEQPKQGVSMRSVAQSAVDLVAGRITSAGVKVIFTGPDVIMFGHYQRLLQLYINLIDNAVKFMGDQPEPLIEIGSYYDNVHKQNVCFVRDNGAGIDPRYHDKVFGLFEKLDNNTEGTGIGLALIKRIVEVHNGSVWFTSEGPGKGTTFYFTLEGMKI